MKKTLGLILFVAMIIVSSCYYDSEEKLYPQVSSACDLSNVTYSKTVVPILQASCLSCHSNSASGNSGGGIRLENYSDVQTMAKNGKLMGTINHASGYQAMPQGGGKLIDCEISQLQTWIDLGTLNN
ncbi:MAG: cytochrome c [Prolixibacteraceae bacterium]